MKIKIKDKTYESGRITAAMSRRAMELNMKALDAAAKAQTLRDNPNADNAGELLRVMYGNIADKAALICSVFDHAFTADELLEELTPAELNGLLNEIVSGK